MSGTAERPAPSRHGSLGPPTRSLETQDSMTSFPGVGDAPAAWRSLSGGGGGSSFHARSTRPLVPPHPPQPATSSRSEFKVLFALAGPTIVQTASQQAMVFTDQIFLGHLGTEEFAAAALGNMYAAFLTFFLFGTATALDTLGAQAYGAQKLGAKGTSLVTWTVTSAIVMTMLSIPVMVGLTLGVPISTGLLGQGPEVAHLMSVFCDGLIPGILPLMWSMILMKYLQVQNVVLGPAFVTAGTFLLNIASNAVFIHLMGFKGAALATSFSRFVQFVAMVGMVAWFERCRDGPPTRLTRFLFQGADDSEPMQGSMAPVPEPPPFGPITPAGIVDVVITASGASGSSDPAKGLSGGGALAPSHRPMTTREFVTAAVSKCKEAMRPQLLLTYLKLGVPGGVMMSAEQGGFDFTTALAGRLGPATVSAHSALLNIVGLTFVSCPFAVGIAGSIRVGNLLGSGRPAAARLASWLCVAIGGGFMAACALVILATKDVIGHVFTSDPEVIAIMATLAPMCALFQVSDGLMGTAQGVLRGCGKQRLLMVYNFVGFWGCGVLLGYLLCFKAGLGIAGLWWGIASGDTVTSVLNLVTLGCVRWRKESEAAQRQLHAGGDDEQDSEGAGLVRHQEGAEYHAVASSDAAEPAAAVGGGLWEPRGGTIA